MGDYSKFIRSDAIYRESKKVDFLAEGREYCYSLQVFDRRHGRTNRFLIPKESLREWYRNGREKRWYYDSDCGNFLTIRYEPDGNYVFELVWLDMKSYTTKEVKGYKQEFTLPARDFEKVVCDGRDCSALVYEDRESHTSFDWSHATRVLKDIQKNPKIRRAFSKAMRDSMHWNNTHFVMYPDFEKCSFYFEAGRMNGGLILSKYNGVYKYSTNT